VATPLDKRAGAAEFQSTTLRARTMPSSLLNKTEAEKKSSYDDLEQLDALWASFRLPIPIPVASEGKNDNCDDPSSGHDGWLLELLDLLRLLHTMDRQYANNAKDQNRARASRVMNSQMALAYSTLSRVERTCPFSPRAYESMAEEDSDRIFQRSVHILLQKARNHTQETCAKLQRLLDQPSSHPAQRHQKKQVPQERDLIHDIFLAPATPESISGGEDESEPLDEFSIGEGDDDKEETVARIDITAQASTHVQSQRQQPPRIPPTKELDPVEFQKQQQELLEEELASMASRLKSSTLAMNATLQSQTKDLDDMEHMAQTNLDQVTDTTKKVEARLTKQRGWKKRLATWSMIGTVIGMWILCFMVMKTVPKRKIGKINLFGRFRDGRNRFLDTWRRYFSKDEDEEMSRDGKAQWQEQQRRWQMWGLGYWQRKQEQHRTQQECEIHSDGTQTCYDVQDDSGRMEAVARKIEAERNVRRIVEKMVNASTDDVVESDSATDEEGPIHDAVSHDESSDDDQNRSHISDDPMGCISPTEEMVRYQTELDSLRIALNQLEHAMERVPVGSPERLQMSKDQDELQSELKNLSSAFALERNKARSMFWADKTNRINAMDHRRALGSVPFCEGEVIVGEFSKHEEDIKQDHILTERMKKNEERARLAANRQEQERLVKQAELERLEKEQVEQAEADRAKQERLAEEARIEVERLEQERLAALIEQERALVEQMQKEKEAAWLEKERLAAEAEKLAKEARLETESLEHERLAVEAATQAEFERLERERLATEAARMEEERLAAQQEKLAKEARLEAERLERERRAMETAKQAELERLEMERLVAEAARMEEERLAAEAERLNQVKLAQEARLEAERLENERLAAAVTTQQAELERLERERLAVEDAKKGPEKENTLEKVKVEAETGAKEAIDLAMRIAAERNDFLPSDVRFAAGRLKNDLLARYISVAPEMVEDFDKNGWRPIHEAARAGNLIGIQLLISAGCNLNSRTGRKGNGGTALWWAIQRFGEDHSAVKLLRYHGALDAGPVA
jgi:hypothetical protein